MDDFSFNLGAIVALGMMAKNHGEPSMAADIAREMRQLKKVEKARIEQLEAENARLVAAIREHKKNTNMFDEDGVFYGPSTKDAELWAAIEGLEQ